MQLISIIIAIALALIVGIVTHFVTISNLKKDADSKIGNAESKAREIIDDAVKTAETTKKEALLEEKMDRWMYLNDLAEKIEAQAAAHK